MQISRRGLLKGLVGAFAAAVLPLPKSDWIFPTFYPVYPEIIWNEIMAVEPMKAPTAEIFRLEYQYERD